ncbi:hypothetical protein ATANTOWER_005108 [Ataeniobius toweri]|uniref:Uncharacterized protein n=1 Tax=Ataeniobius toweri TaxID=208326 RepID=A0ABU7A1M8_9TELE|nr:hypothetical protein [Ataeniobius toweri]
MSSQSIVPHFKTIGMCGVANVREEGMGAKPLPQILLGASSPTGLLLSCERRPIGERLWAPLPPETPKDTRLESTQSNRLPQQEGSGRAQASQDPRTTQALAGTHSL